MVKEISMKTVSKLFLCFISFLTILAIVVPVHFFFSEKLSKKLSLPLFLKPKNQMNMQLAQQLGALKRVPKQIG